jgi:hypothetical protein
VEEDVAAVMGEEVVEVVDVKGIRRRFGEEDMRIVTGFVRGGRYWIPLMFLGQNC